MLEASVSGLTFGVGADQVPTHSAAIKKEVLNFILGCRIVEFENRFKIVF